MLNKLFGSNARVKILKLFLSNPDKMFYIRQIARDLKLQLNSVRRELENLEKFGILATITADSEKGKPDDDHFVATKEDLAAFKNFKKEAKGEKEAVKRFDKKFYRANKNFVLYEEIKSLMTKAQILYERDFVEKLKVAGSPKLVILTGFFVNDEARPVDLFLVGRMNKPGLLKLISELESELGRELNYTIMDLKEFQYRREITDVFLYDILEGRKIIVINEVGIT